MNRNAAEQTFAKRKLMAELLRDLAQYFDCFPCDLGADPVTGKYQYV